MESLHIRLALKTPMLTSTQGFLTLDGLLASLYEQHRREPASLEVLPLAHVQGLACASIALIEQGEAHMHQMYGGLTPEDLRSVMEHTLPRKRNARAINQDSGKYIRSSGRYLAIDTQAVHWFCVGDAGGIWSLLERAAGIGCKATAGWGAIDWQESEIEPWQADWSWIKSGQPMRPIPLESWKDIAPAATNVQIGQATVSHPYWDGPRVECALPRNKLITWRTFLAS